jgi:uncharacterized protein (TIGR02996 family)
VTTQEALLAAVLANPEDDLPRLVYADWCDENGQGERAEHIRTAARHRDVGYSFVPWFRKSGPPYWGVGSRGNRSLTRRGVTKLLTAEFSGLLLRTTCPWVNPVGAAAADHPEEDARSIITLHFRRGFLETIICPLADWLSHGPAIVRRHPVARVEATDRRPYDDLISSFDMGRPLAQNRHVWSWLESDTPPHRDHLSVLHGDLNIPLAVAKHLTGRRSPDLRFRRYDEPGAAEADLSAALIAWAKSASPSHRQ